MINDPRTRSPHGNFGCGSFLGAMIGLVLARAATDCWVRPGAWYEWPIVIAIVLSCAVLAARAVNRWGEAAWLCLIWLLQWC